MHVVKAVNVNQLWPKLLELVQTDSERQYTRNGPAKVVPVPVGVVYAAPLERVLLDPLRDANPFFCLFESLFMLAGRDDAAWLDRFVSDFSARYAEKDGRMHGAYGRRWRNWFPRLDREENIDQLDVAVELLKADPATRQAVIQMWDPSADLGPQKLADRPCNQQVLLRADRGKLDMTVTSRSGDIAWGLTTANCVHFSVLGEYLAARLGIPLGTYTHFTHNLHLYEAVVAKCNYASAHQNSIEPYPGTRPLVDDAASFDEELARFMEDPEGLEPYHNKFFQDTAQPLWLANEFRREGKWQHALVRASQAMAPDWRAAAVTWLQRRAEKHGDAQ